MTLFRPEQRNAQTLPWREVAQRVGRLPALDVNRDAALTHSAVYECVDLIADLVAGFPVQRFYRDAEGVRRLATDPAPVITSPSTDDDPVNWRRILVVSWLLRGFGAGIASGEDERRMPKTIELIHPDRVGASRPREDAPWRWMLDGKQIERWPDGPLWVAPGKKLAPGDPLGRSVLQFASVEVGLGLSSRKFGADFFGSGGHPTGMVMTDQAVNEDMATRVKRRFLDAAGGNREPIVMGGGWKYEQIQIAPNESQFLETIKANRTIVAGFFKVPPGRIGAPSGDGMTYKNVAQDDLALLKFCIQPWIDRMEATLNPLTPPGEYVKLNADALLRVDALTRTMIEDRLIKMGKNSVNEIRALEDEPPIEGGDRYLWPPMRMQLTADELEEGADNESGQEQP